MNGITIRGRSKQFRGEMRRRWSRLTGNRIGQFRGQALKMAGTFQVGYGQLRQRVGI